MEDIRIKGRAFKVPGITKKYQLEKRYSKDVYQDMLACDSKFFFIKKGTYFEKTFSYLMIPEEVKPSISY